MPRKKATSSMGKVLVVLHCVHMHEVVVVSICLQLIDSLKVQVLLPVRTALKAKYYRKSLVCLLFIVARFLCKARKSSCTHSLFQSLRTRWHTGVSPFVQVAPRHEKRGSILQSDEQPSPLTVFPSSHDSELATLPSPHAAVHTLCSTHFQGADTVRGPEHVCVDST